MGRKSDAVNTTKEITQTAMHHIRTIISDIFSDDATKTTGIHPAVFMISDIFL
ncbi:hypothetical protein Ppb6_02953 [Photorhabdus australis subsp. thailandensis]|uniref:Uncharacterized protein n=1 Tax=Photorhabdus australis subsp. thailandensis TaxID=2805096 RepID=A0A1C0U1N8_9GAMM|nr:hypothetical protein Ppb6_02953 [Photorhabdus australis subsp. thailandensis]